MLTTRQTPVGPLHEATAGEAAVDLGRISHAIIQVPEGARVALGGALAAGPGVPMRDAFGAAVVLASPGLYRTPVPTRFLTVEVIGEGSILIQPE